MVEENVLFDRTGMHLAILAQVNRSLRKTIRPAAGVQPVHVGFVLGGSDARVQHAATRRLVSGVTRECSGKTLLELR